MWTKLKQQLAQRERAKWEAGLAWFRLRYAAAAGTTRCLYLLSQAEACGRVALAFQPGVCPTQPVAQLCLGLPGAHAALLQRMAGDFGFTLTPVSPLDILADSLVPATTLPWQRPFLAHIVCGHLFVTGEDGTGMCFPAPDGADVPTWTLPETPPLGLSLTASWPSHPAPESLLVAPDPTRWLLGWDSAGNLLSTPGRVNVYGSAAADWLVPQLGHTLTAGHAGLVILDGKGDLVPQLKRKAAVTKLLGNGLSYVDLDNPALVDGLDPLAPVTGETEEGRSARRTTWFQQMGVHPLGLDLLAEAPLTDLAGLQKWLHAPAQQRQRVAATAVETVLTRLLADKFLRIWLDWPANRFATLPEGALLFACRGRDWARQQLLLAALLAACALPEMRLVLHGLPWARVDIDWLPTQVLVSNGPLLAGALPVLTACAPQPIPDLARRFCREDPILTENLYVLPPGQGVVCHERGIQHTTWQPSETRKETQLRLDAQV